jgi:hypothetical protein
VDRQNLGGFDSIETAEFGNASPELFIYVSVSRSQILPFAVSRLAVLPLKALVQRRSRARLRDLRKSQATLCRLFEYSLP